MVALPDLRAPMPHLAGVVRGFSGGRGVSTLLGCRVFG
jgi:hypothetical protein